MANIAYVPVTSNWTLVSDLIGNGFSFDASTTYVIEARGLGDVLLLDTDSVPASNSDAGVRLDGNGYKIAKYKVAAGNDLYVKLNRSSMTSGINISTEEGE